MESLRSETEVMKLVLADGEAFNKTFKEVFNNFDANNNGLIEYSEIM
jgi:Ca2+-binding EF-hand superfamily protein